VTDMPDLLGRMDVMVLPSYREGLPRSLIEAAAAGLPIVTTDVPGCREVVEDGVNGFLVPARSSSKLADALRKLINDPALAAEMGSAGRLRALEKFDERLIFDKTVAVYRELNAGF
jgi:glycosyltransferase involved in cell wall biosynthesis